MYEKIVSYFESQLCVENIYFRRNYILWIVGIVITFILELIVNNIISNLISNIWVRTGIILFIDFFMTFLFFVFAYVLPINKIYKEKIKEEIKLDILGLLMREERLSVYRATEIKEMTVFLREKCKINNIESINTIIDIINEEIKDKYTKKNFVEKYFNNTILPILILVLTIYFTNTNEQNLANILTTTIMSILSIIFTGNLITKLKNINITPVRKKENLLELKRVLMDIKIKMKS